MRVAVRLEGYEPWARAVTPTGSLERVDATLVPTPAAALAPSSAQLPEEAGVGARSPGDSDSGRGGAVASGRAKKRRSKRKASPSAPPAGTGRLSLRSTGAWAEVYLGRRKLGTTPLSSVEVPAGRLRLRLLNAAAGIDEEIEVRVSPDRELRRTVSLQP